MTTTASETTLSTLAHPALGKNVTAVLGPTNTGKTHLAIERMLGHQSGLIGLPLRLLAREVYDKIVAKIGTAATALITGEEKIIPPHARYYICTVEAMPRDIDVEFLAIDEVQLAADLERGHIFTNRLLHARGSQETLFLGSATMRDAINELFPGTHFISRPRLSKLSYSGQKKVTRLPRRSAIVAFSVNDVYAIAELMRRQRGGTAVVLGALSPKTRNAQVELYQSGDVDFLVATDAIGMGLNLLVDHVAFAGTRKFDGQMHRELTPSELAQIAGRAGRHINDGTFGVTANAEPFASEIIARIEEHNFEPVRGLQWRNHDLDFSSLDHLKASLNAPSNHPRLGRARMADDMIVLENLSLDPDILALCKGPAALRQLWDICQIPDYRKISIQNHSELLGHLFKFISHDDEFIPEDWFAEQVKEAERYEGDIDTLSTRIAHIRTWTFVSNRKNWLKDPLHWQHRTREIEDKLSDALHEKLTQRFVDRRTSVLMRRLRDEEELYAEIGDEGAVHVENHFVGRLNGFRFTPDPKAEGVHGKAMRNAASIVLTKELAMRARRIIAAKNDAFTLNRRGDILWRGEDIARLEAGADQLSPQVILKTDEHLSGPDQEKVQARLESWIKEEINTRLKPLVDLSQAQDIDGLARGIAFQLYENYGILKRDTVSEEIRSLDQNARAQLRKYGVRFGAFNIFCPVLLKPAASELLMLLWSVSTYQNDPEARANLPEPPKAGLTSVVADKNIDEAFYRAAGFQLCGARAVRIDMLERLGDMIRPLVAWRKNANQQQKQNNSAQSQGKPPQDKPNATATNEAEDNSPATTMAATAPDTASPAPATDTPASDTPASEAPAVDAQDNEPAGKEGKASTAAEPAEEPAEEKDATADKNATEKSAKSKPSHKAEQTEAPLGATGDGGFTVQPEMMSIMGCSAAELAPILRSLGFRMESRKVEPSRDASTERAIDSPEETSTQKADMPSAKKPKSIAQPTAPQESPEALSKQSEASIEAKSESAAEAEAHVEIIEIWRPKRRKYQKQHQSRRFNKNRAHGAQNSNAAGEQSAGQHGQAGAEGDTTSAHTKNRKKRLSKYSVPHSGSGQSEAGRNRKSQQKGKSSGGAKKPHKKQEKKIDPDSPFAALSKLKKELEHKDQA